MIGVWATTVAILATWLLLLWWWVRHDSRSSSRKKVVPPAGSLGLPLVGESLQLIWAFRSSDPEPFLDWRRSRYGSVFTTHVFGKRTVFSTDADVNRFILQNEGRLFEACYPSSISTLLGRHSLLVMPSVLPLHRRLHSVTLNFASRHAALLSHIDRLVCRALLSWPSNGRLLLHPHAKKITFELTVKQLLGLDPGEWSEKVRKQYLRLIDGFFCLPLPLPFTTYGNALKARAKVAEELRTVVRSRREQLQRRQNLKENKNETEMEMEEDDMLGLLMGDAELSEEHMVDMLLSLLVAGYETTSTIMTLCVKFLTETPLALAQLKEEHDTIRRRRRSSSSISESHEKLEWGDYKAMTFTQCVINETLRIANIIAGVFRRALVDSEIKGYTIPQGWMVFPCFRAVHLDQDNYEDARKFNPWRWQPKGSSLAANASFGPNFTPFGGGPRLCPGYELARVEISVFLHHLVTMFSWTAAEHDELIFFPTTRTKKNFPIMLTRRKLPKSIAT